MKTPLLVAASAAVLAVAAAVLLGVQPAMATAGVLAVGFMAAVTAQVLWGAGPRRLERTFTMVGGLAAGALGAGAAAYVIERLWLG